MKNAEDRLASIGFARNRREPVCWHVAPLDRPNFSARPPEDAPDPARSPALGRWRILLGREPRPTPYRISRIEG
ncbi:MAG TPA: hypothetical protein VGQ90_08465 [Stellaceae bacterium]|nr:hypothetical protein [Stellaceae bacterium]